MYRNFPDFDKQEIKLTLLYVRSAFQRGKCGAGWNYKYIVDYFAIGSYDLVIGRQRYTKVKGKTRERRKFFRFGYPKPYPVLSKDMESRTPLLDAG